MKQLMEHSWPRNIRELENAIEHAFVLCNSDQIELENIPIEIRDKNCLIKNVSGFPEYKYTKGYNKTDISARLIKDTLLELLEKCNWNKAEVGRQIQKSRTSVWNYMKKWSIPLHKQ